MLGEKRIHGSAAHLWDEDVAAAVDLIARGAVDADQIITARIPLEDVVAAGFGALEDHTSGALKVLVQPTPASRPHGGAMAELARGERRGAVG